LCSNQEGNKTVSLQVKTNKTDKSSWILNKKAEKFYNDNHFYIFVCLNNNMKPPDFYIVPSKVVANYVRTSHRKWLNLPQKNGQTRMDSSIRKFMGFFGGGGGGASFYDIWGGKISK
jgi:hypothetical protein